MPTHCKICRATLAYIHAVARKNGEDPTNTRTRSHGLPGAVRRAFAGADWRTFRRALCLIRPGEEFFACPQCRRIHLHRAGGVCIDCLVPLALPQPISCASEGRRLLQFPRHAGRVTLFRLNCEELTGQKQRQRPEIVSVFSKASACEPPEKNLAQTNWTC